MASGAERPRFFLRPLRPEDSVTGFSIGDDSLTPLKTFLRRQAKDFHKKDVVKTYVLVDKPEPSTVRGFLSLVCSEIRSEVSNQMTEGPAQFNYETFPAVKLVRMAVDSRYRSLGLGSTMIDWCISHVATNVSKNVGCRFLVVDSKESAIRFYSKNGFTQLNSDIQTGNRQAIMFIDLYKLNQGS